MNELFIHQNPDVMDNIVEKMVKDWSCPAHNYDGCPDLRCAVMETVKIKDSELKNHEQSLLWTVEYILDRLCVEGEAREIALDEFKSHLVNKFE